MPVIIQKPFMDVRASRGIVQNYFPVPTQQGVNPPNNYKAMQDMWRRDEVIATAVDTTVDMTTRNGYDFVPKSDDKTKSKTERNKALKLFSELNFTEVLDNLIYQMVTYGDAFLELRRENVTFGKINELHPLETTEMVIDYDKNGKVNGYIQHPTSAANGDIRFPSDGVIHMRMKWMGSRVYSETPLEPIARIWATKQNSFNYLDQMFMNLHPELFIHLKGASKEQYEQAREVIYRYKTQPGRPVVTYGSKESGTEVKEVTARFGNEQGLKWVLEYLREAVLMITRVPPVWVGVVNNDGANRGNSEAQIFSFETRIRKIQQKVQDKINRELLPLLGFFNIEFNFNPISFKMESDTMKNAAVAHSMGIKPEGIIRLLKRNGITDFREDDFPDPEEMMEQMNQTASNITSPSREPADKDEMTNNRDRNGVSAAGKKKMEDNAMKTRSMNGYPYMYDALVGETQ